MGTWIIGLALLAAVALIVRKLLRDRKAGKCAGGCAGCEGCCHFSTDQPPARK